MAWASDLAGREEPDPEIAEQLGAHLDATTCGDPSCIGDCDTCLALLLVDEMEAPTQAELDALDMHDLGALKAVIVGSRPGEEDEDLVVVLQRPQAHGMPAPSAIRASQLSRP